MANYQWTPPQDGHFHLGRDFGLTPDRGKLNVLQAYGSLAEAIRPDRPLKDGLSQFYRRWREGLNRSDADFLKLAIAVAQSNECVWRGHDQDFFDIYTGPEGQGNGHYCFSRMPIVMPYGRYLINYHVDVPSAEYIGAGTHPFYGPRILQSTEWEECPPDQWLGDKVTPAIRSVNWGVRGNSGYHEALRMRKMCYKGASAASMTAGYMRSSFGSWFGGTASLLDELVGREVSGDVVEAVGSTPTKFGQIAGFRVGRFCLGAIGWQLGSGNVEHIEIDDGFAGLGAIPGYGFQSAPKMTIGGIKCENGVTAGRGEVLGTIPLYLVGQFGIDVGMIWACNNGQLCDAMIVVDPRTTDGARQASHLKIGEFTQKGYDSVLHDISRQGEWHNHGAYEGTSLEYHAKGSGTCVVGRQEQLSFRPVGGTQRLGMADAFIDADRALGKPVYPFYVPISPSAVPPVTPPVTPPPVVVDPPPVTPPTGSPRFAGGPYTTNATSWVPAKVDGVTKIVITDFTPANSGGGKIIGTGAGKPFVQLSKAEYGMKAGLLYYDGKVVSDNTVPFTAGKKVAKVVLTFPTPINVLGLFQTDPAQGGAQLGTYGKVEIW